MMKALLLVDIQNDFLPGGSVAVPQGNEVVPIANRLLSQFELVVASQDWHPVHHGSFAANHPGKKLGERITLNGLTQILWPNHCVQGSRGAQLVSDLQTEKIQKVFQKGTDSEVDSYSTFFDNARRKNTGLAAYLKDRGVTEIYLMGLATDYCVKFSALDAVSLGFKTFLIEDGCRGVNLQPDDSQKAIQEMRNAGVQIISSRFFK